jgi:ribosomal protein S12 methylthiotransferase accessory factor
MIQSTTDARPIVFLGPSMPLAQARQILDADYRPPIRRGDLEPLAAGTVVGMIDGVFEQERSVSPREVQQAVARGVHIVAGGSMGALRAAEVRGVVGVGLVYQWYRDGVITRDDEVALVFDQERALPLSVPLVNVRFAVERLARPGTIDRALAERLVAAAAELPYERRTYRAIIEQARLAGRADSADLITMLEATDLKRQDAQVVLETVDSHLQEPRTQPPAPAGARKAPPAVPDVAVAPAAAAAPVDSVSIWESGDVVTMSDLVAFLGFTGKLERYGREAIARYALADNRLTVPQTVVVPREAAQKQLNAAARRWGWVSAEEAQVTLGDLGVDLSGLGGYCREESVAVAVARGLIAAGSAAFRAALRAELFLDDMALKREAMRLGAVRFFAARAPDEPPFEEVAAARQVLCKLNDELELATLRKRWTALGLGDEAAQDGFVNLLARARVAGRRLARQMAGGSADHGPPPPLALPASPKPGREARFSLPLAEAMQHVQRLREVIGVTRVGMIGELADIGGVQVAQAARPDNAWSSSYGSGKALTREGAVVGSIMEETEKWAQEQFRPGDDRLRFGSFAQLAADDIAVVDPGSLDLPYDSVYRPDLPLAWYPCTDLGSGREVLVPLDVLRMARGKHDICYTQRGARKHLATNGLGSGFTAAEAILHGLCEYVERHALRFAELRLSNPGGLGAVPYDFVDLATVNDRIRALAGRLHQAGAAVAVLDITSEIGIPTFLATITRDLKRADGHAAHPCPETAIEMALLEAAQTISCSAAGGREDLSIRARSLGRHERPRPLYARDAWFWLDPDRPLKPVQQRQGFSGEDIRDELGWCLQQVRRAGLDQVIVFDLTVPAIRPAHVVRVLVPGLESNNPFYTGPRARLALLGDMLPRPARQDDHS